MMDSGWIIKCMGMGHFRGPINVNTLELMKMTKKVDTGNFIGRMEEIIKVNLNFG